MTSPDFSFSRASPSRRDVKRRSRRHDRDRRRKIIRAKPPRRLCADCPAAGIPTFAAAALLLKLARHDIAGGVLLFVVLTSVLHGLFTPWLAPKFPKFFKHGYEPLFFNAGLSFSEKIAKWRERPTTSVQLVTSELMLALLAVAVVSMK